MITEKRRRLPIKKGLNIPIAGAPEQSIGPSRQPGTVALIGSDYVGMKPQLRVSVGDDVKLGQVLFTDRKIPSIQYISPGCGRVVEINRGEKRKLLSIIIRLEGDDEVTFPSFPEHQLSSLDRKTVMTTLLESGLWTALRARPYGKVADPETTPHSLFVTAIDTNPLGPSVAKIIEGRGREFSDGLKILSNLTDGPIYLCKAPEEMIPEPELHSLVPVEFSGPHPAGNVGTHIHFLDPVGRNKTVWYINAQDVISVGILFATGRVDVERVIALAGPSVLRPRLIRTRMGASLEDITSGELREGEQRIISGSVLSGHTGGVTAFLGRYHQQVSVIPEERKREFLNWLLPGFNLYSLQRMVFSRFLPNKKFDLTSSLHGETRAIYPIGTYEKVMPLDILSTFLLRALAIDDLEEAENLGCLELDEEDLALCSFVCPSKIDHGSNLRRNLTLLEKEG